MTALHESADSLEQFDHAFRITGADGEIKWLRSIAQPQRLENGDVVWDGVTVDVTEHKLAQAALRASQAQPAEIAANIPGGVYRRVLHPDGRISFPYLDPGSEEVYGLEADRIMTDPNSFLDNIHDEDRDGWYEALRASAKDLSQFDHDFRVINRLGEVIWMRSIAKPNRMANGDVVWDGVTINITQQKQTELALLESRQILSEIACNLPGAIFRHVLHADGTIEYPYIGAGTQELYGRQPAEVVADVSRFFEAVHPENLPGWRAAVEKSARWLEPFQHDMRLIDTSDQVKWVRFIARPYRADNGDVVWDGVTIDISEQKVAEAALRETEQRFRTFAEAALDTFWEMDESQRFSFSAGTRARDHENPLMRMDILGKTRWELAGADPDRDEKWRRHKADLEAHQPFRNFRYSVNDNEGRTRHLTVSGTPNFDHTGAFKGYRGTVADISSEVEARAQLADAIESLSEGFALFDEQDRLVQCNT